MDQANKIRLLTHWLQTTDWTRTLVFTRTKHRADKVAKLLQKSGIEADAFHADKSQSTRQRTLARFKSPDPVVLIATNIAARGLDIDMVSHVIDFDLPVDAENYVHRIGRTGRAARTAWPCRSATSRAGGAARHSAIDEADGRGCRSEGTAGGTRNGGKPGRLEAEERGPAPRPFPTRESRSGRASAPAYAGK